MSTLDRAYGLPLNSTPKASKLTKLLRNEARYRELKPKSERFP
jgi:hypothetical protein